MTKQIIMKLDMNSVWSKAAKAMPCSATGVPARVFGQNCSCGRGRVDAPTIITRRLHPMKQHEHGGSLTKNPND